VSGEPGAGKTRLVEEFRRWCERRRAVTATCEISWLSCSHST